MNTAKAQAQLSNTSIEIWQYKETYVIVVKGIQLPKDAVKIAEIDRNGNEVKEKDSDRQ